MMDEEAMYRALVARDPRFDGLFFVGIRSTGVYCRSICPARTAGRGQCVFFEHAAQAASEGFRPCLRCRPELAPGTTGTSDRVDALVAEIRAGAMNGRRPFADLARTHGLSERQGRRLVRETTGVTPVQLSQTARLLLAKQLLTETSLPIIRIASASGYSSLRRFNEAFVASCGVSPTRFRGSGRAPRSDALTLRLDHRPPYDWPAMRGFLEARLIRGVDVLEDDGYRRTIRIGDHVGALHVRSVEGRFMVQV
ncbi:MAG: DNA-3-methyladenine glycosylase 2 family protein, partial [Phycisphaerales bacterium]|nr:DNA-3-methyladenine glycosylase 2 family protein [Phycisphaerales bacterium]